MLVYIKPLSIFPKLHSDTIFGAIISAVSELYPESLEELLLKFKEYPPFTVSSAFPFLFNEKEKLRFFPKIINSGRGNNDSSNWNILDNRKKFKKVEFIEEKLFFKMISGDLKESEIIEDLENYKIYGNLLTEATVNIQGKYKDTVIPNNTVNRITQESEAIFYSEGYEFDNMGLFFLVDFKEKKYESIIKATIRFLKDRGFGKDISTGKGHFDLEGFDEGYNLPDIDGNYFITISRFIPNEEDLTKINKFSSYEIGSKRGRSVEGELRRQVRFFKEGSIFPVFNEFCGKIVDSGTNYPAVEYGYAFPVRYNLMEDE
jgi:CRISPR-associated protein Csm4